MKCRKVIREFKDEPYNLVMFGSYGTQYPTKIKWSLSSKKSDEINELSDLVFDDDKFIFKGVDSITIDNTHLNDNLLGILFEDSVTDGYDTINLDYYSDDKCYKRTSFDMQSTDNSPYFLVPVYKRAKFYDQDTHTNYANLQEGVQSSLIQRLSVIKSELWYHINYGLPLFDKINNKSVFDTVIIDIILSHKDVTSIKNYVSNVTNHVYTFSCDVMTIYGEEIQLSNAIG